MSNMTMQFKTPTCQKDMVSFPWQEKSFVIALEKPLRKYFDADKFNWKEHSWSVAAFMPDKMSDSRYDKSFEINDDGRSQFDRCLEFAKNNGLKYTLSKDGNRLKIQKGHYDNFTGKYQPYCLYFDKKLPQDVINCVPFAWSKYAESLNECDVSPPPACWLLNNPLWDYKKPAFVKYAKGKKGVDFFYTGGDLKANAKPVDHHYWYKNMGNNKVSRKGCGGRGWHKPIAKFKKSILDCLWHKV